MSPVSMVPLRHFLTEPIKNLQGTVRLLFLSQEVLDINLYVTRFSTRITSET